MQKYLYKIIIDLDYYILKSQSKNHNTKHISHAEIRPETKQTNQIQGGEIYMMTPRENVLEVINWGSPEYVPMTGEAFYLCGLGTTPMFEQPWVSGKDPFGVDWIVTSTGAMHDVTKIWFDTVSDWEKYVKFPDLDAVDITEMAAGEMSQVDRNQVLVTYYHPVGVFERLVSFMGFENALIALVDDPESCMEFFDAVTDYKIKVADKVIDAYHPDVYVYFDDVASAANIFMAPDIYRAVIKPYHRKFSQHIIQRGVIPEQHTCGKCQALLEDYVDIGIKIWHSAQILNDLPGIQERFRGRLVIEGGWDSSGVPGYVDATEDDIREEVRRDALTFSAKCRKLRHFALNCFTFFV